MTLLTVPSSAVWRPAACRSSRIRKALVVLPFVPVMPTTARRAVGSPWKRAAIGAIAARTDATCTSGNAEPEGALDHQRARSARDGVGREVVAVAREPGHAEEQRSRGDAAVVEREAGDLDVCLDLGTSSGSRMAAQ